jgi:pimeloyl-ACP methyl ester carboxylesterase
VHGALLNEVAWRDQLTTLCDLRRVITIELLSLFETNKPSDGDWFRANVKMLGEMMSCLKVDHADLVGYEVASDVVQVFAATHPACVRSLTFSEYRPQDDHTPVARNSFLGIVARGHLREVAGSGALLQITHQATDALGLTKQRDTTLDQTIETYKDTSLDGVQGGRDRRRFITCLNNEHTVAVVSLLKELEVPSFLVWEEEDALFGAEWDHTLSQITPGTVQQLGFRAAEISPIDVLVDDLVTRLRNMWQSSIDE